MFRVAFNTAFFKDPLPNEGRKSTIEFSLNDLDPSQLIKDERFDKNFKMIVFLLLISRLVLNFVIALINLIIKIASVVSHIYKKRKKNGPKSMI